MCVLVIQMSTYEQGNLKVGCLWRIKLTVSSIKQRIPIFLEEPTWDGNLGCDWSINVLLDCLVQRLGVLHCDWHSDLLLYWLISLNTIGAELTSMPLVNNPEASM